MDQVRSNKKEQRTNFKLLWIISIFMIIVYNSFHYGITANYTFTNWKLNVDIKVISDLFAIFGKLGVAIIVLITSYFLCNRDFNKDKSLDRVSRLFKLLWFFSWLFLIVNWLFRIVPFNASVLLKMIFPFLYSEYWFISSYIFLVLLSPILNLVIYRLNKRQLRAVMLFLLLFDAIIPLILRGANSTLVNNHLFSFITLYFVAAYIRNFFDSDQQAIRYGKSLLGYGIGINILVTLVVNLIAIHTHNLFLFNLASLITIYSYKQFFSIVTIITAVGMFLIFKQARIKSNKFINFLSATALGVYLMSANPVMIKLMWGTNGWFRLADILHQSIGLAFGHILLNVLIFCPLIFMLCSILDYFRQKLFILITKVRSNKQNSKII